MSQPKFTPGPWRISTSRSASNSIEGPGRKLYEGSDGYHTVATFQDCCESRSYEACEANMAANGRLIAAAPDLYRLCSDALEYLTPKRDRNPEVNALCERLSEVLARITGASS